MRHCLAWTGIVGIALLLQSTVFAVFSYEGIKPDLLLIVVISAALLFGKDTGVVTGFFAGLLQDLSTGTFFGVNTFSKMLLGYGFGMAEEHVFKDNIFLPILAILGGTFANAMITMIFMLLLGHKVELSGFIVSALCPMLIYNLLMTFPVYKLISKISTWIKA